MGRRIKRRRATLMSVAIAFGALIVVPLPAVTASSAPEAWVQLGGDIDGEAQSDQSGSSVAMSGDGSTVIVGARLNDDGGSQSGHARVYRYDGSGWAQIGGDIDGEADGDTSGASVAISDNGNTVIVGAPFNDGTAPVAGHARVYRFDGSSWVQVGADIDGEAGPDESGTSVAMSSDGNTVIIGAPYNDASGSDNEAGHARVHHFDGANWVQVGGDIDGQARKLFGKSVAMNSDGTAVIIGTPHGTGLGLARVYQLEDAAWVQVGSDIEGNGFGKSVAMSSDGSMVITGASSTDGSQAGQGWVYEFDGATWVQVGEAIDGEAADQSGSSVDMSSDGHAVAIGATRGSGANPPGKARTYRLEGTTWVQFGGDIVGEAPWDNSGSSVAMSGDGDQVIVGAPDNDGFAVEAGHARVYSLQSGLKCQGQAATIVGTSGDDVLVGTAGNDVIVGLGGDDKIYGKRGDDTLCGNRGWDIIRPGKGDDFVSGGSGSRDWVSYSSGWRAVVVSLRDGIGTGQGRDTLVGIERVVGSPFDDELTGNAHSNRIRAGAGADTVWGRGGDDFLWGNAGDDVLRGGAGTDFAHGGQGSDTCTAEAQISC